MKEIQLHTSIQEELLVTEALLACNVGSGSVCVYATPMMIAAMEHAACSALAPFLEEGETSVGIMIHSSHDAATPQGMKVFVEATITAVKGKKVSFEIIARDEKDMIGKATHDRFIVVQERFEAKANQKKG